MLRRFTDSPVSHGDVLEGGRLLNGSVDVFDSLLFFCVLLKGNKVIKRRLFFICFLAAHQKPSDREEVREVSL